jgi:hypothetical protein
VSQGEEILESAKKYVEEKISALDEPAPEMIQASAGEYSLDKIQNITLLASGEDEEEPFKATLLKAPRPTPEQANLDDKVLDYIKVKNTYNVIEIATSLGVPVDKIEQSIFRLASCGKTNAQEVE